MDKILSIIIPTYNMENYLDRCLSSLVIGGDLLKEVEVLVINDGSRDRSLEIAKDFESRYPMIFRIIDKENGNYGSCVNRGLKEAVGKYIKVLDADDYFDKDCLATFLSFLKVHDADLFITDFQQVYNNGEVVNRFTHKIPMKKELRLIDHYLSDDFKYLQMHAVTYKRQNLIDIAYKQTEGISYTDAQWVFLPMSTVKVFYYCPIVLYNYLIGREGQTMDESVYAKSIGQLMKMTLDRIVMYEDYGLRDSVCEAYFSAKLTETLKYIYRFSLVVNNDKLQDLKAFDEEFRNRSMYLYERSNDVVLFDKMRFKLIKYWRSHNYKTLPFCLKIVFLFLYKLSKKNK